jgi:cation transport ATPase
MIEKFVFTAFAVVVVLLGSMEGRSDALRGRYWPFGPRTQGNLDALLGAAIMVASFVSLFWLYRTWSFFWTAGALILTILLSRYLIAPHSLELWLRLRPLGAMATVASAGILWFFAAWP